MTNHVPSRINPVLLRAWWNAGVKATDIADEFGVCRGTLREACRDLGLSKRVAHQPVISLSQYRAARRAAVGDGLMADMLRSAAATRRAMAEMGMVDEPPWNLSRFQRWLG